MVNMEIRLFFYIHYHVSVLLLKLIEDEYGRQLNAKDSKRNRFLNGLGKEKFSKNEELELELGFNRTSKIFD